MQEKKAAVKTVALVNENFESIFLITGLLGMILLITWQVAYRYVITKFTPGAQHYGGAAPEELARYLLYGFLIWLCRLPSKQEI